MVSIVEETLNYYWMNWRVNQKSQVEAGHGALSSDNVYGIKPSMLRSCKYLAIIFTQLEAK
jgi:hypothetical protein